MPYVCIEPECPTPNRSYARRIDWRRHHRQSHRKIWHCPFEDGSSFHTQNAFEEHLMKSCRSITDTGEIGVLVGACTVYDDDETNLHCPLCSKESPSNDSWFRHIGRHQQQLALFCLPSHLQGSDDEGEEAVDGVGNSEDGTDGQAVEDEGPEAELNSQGVDTDLGDSAERLHEPSSAGISRNETDPKGYLQTTPCHFCDSVFWSLREVR